LIELDPVIAGIWAFLIRSSERDIMRLPIDIESVDDVHACQEAKDFIGMQLDLRVIRPAHHRTKTLDKLKRKWQDDGTAHLNHNYCDDDRFWGKNRRARAARQVMGIKHWNIIHGSYEVAPDVDAHWHVDPPYVRAGKNYTHNVIDHAALAQWCLQRKGYLQVCESFGAQWLPFEQVRRSQEQRPGTVAWGGGSLEAAVQQGAALRQLDFQPEGGISGDQQDRTRTTGSVQSKGVQARRRQTGVPAAADKRGGQDKRRRVE